MTTFLTAWLICTLALGLSVVGLVIWYHLIGFDFGGKGFVFEAIVVLVTAALQACGVLLGRYLYEKTRSINADAVILIAITCTGFVYKLTHYEQMSNLELGTLIVANFGSFILLRLLAGSILGV